MIEISKMSFTLSNFVASSFLLLIAIQLNSAEVVWPQCEDSLIANCTSSFPYCPDCSLVDCFPRLDPKACPKDTIYEENVLWGCCPACVKYLSEGKVSLYQYAVLFKRITSIAQLCLLGCPNSHNSFLKHLGNT